MLVRRIVDSAHIQSVRSRKRRDHDEYLSQIKAKKRKRTRDYSRNEKGIIGVTGVL